MKLLLLLLLVLMVSSPHANSGSIVKYLPGFEGPLPFELETGYIGVGKEEQLQLFYYFIKSERNPKEDPLLLWLTGGPGCSAVSALLFENGPVKFRVEGYNGGTPTLLSTTYSWTKIASIIYLDQPVGTGFSYSKTQLLDTPSDSGEAKRIHEFLLKWLDKHIEFISNPFYVTGNSYAGKVIPATVQEISKGNDLGFKPQINLQGYVIGNPTTDQEFDYNHRVPFAHGMALISDELYESLKKTCNGNYEKVDPGNIECLQFVEEYHEAYSELQASMWANDESVQKALHVAKGRIGKWIRCSSEDKPYNKDIKSSVPYHLNNSIKGYPSLIFSGDHDMTIPFTATQTWIRSLNYSIIDKWRPWMIHNQVTGYTKTYANKMTFATVKGGGHTSKFKPEESFIMFQRWISGQPL
ncbi:hypothetical protein BRARA_J01868 [Brassica rapa]|uniref:Uncharacterized protein n=1 Tax=Brassica campestris TaxID=3711 RepID=A0A397XLL0_BRACM|nr:hypothetical protein BRARA_J01868 [Brassica rapa]